MNSTIYAIEILSYFILKEKKKRNKQRKRKIMLKLIKEQKFIFDNSQIFHILSSNTNT